MDNRTAAYKTVVLAYERLLQLVTEVRASQDKGDEDLEHPQVAALTGFIRETLRTTGFWSLWAKYFEARFQADGPWISYSETARRLFLYGLLVQYEIRRFELGVNAMDVDDVAVDDADDDDEEVDED